MVKVLLSVIAITLITGCAGPQVRLKTEVQESYVPILYCPAPPVVERPELAIEKLTPELLEHPGEVVKHYKATIIQLQGMVRELEEVLNQYDQNNEAYKELEKQFKEKWGERPEVKE